MPSAAETISASIVGGHEKARPRTTEPAVYSGSLDSYGHNDLTPSIGREFPNIQIKELLTSPDTDTLIRDLAITGLSHLLRLNNRY
jgi:hypothetical protein